MAVRKDKYDVMDNEALNVIVAMRINCPDENRLNWAADCNDMFNLLGQLEDAVWKVDFAKLDRRMTATVAQAVARFGTITFLRWSDKLAERNAIMEFA